MNITKVIGTVFCITPLLGIHNLYAKNKTNVVFILVDDLGYADLNFMGQKNLHTPNVDRLVTEGMYFSNAYTAAPVSSPSRASIITGKTPAELKLTCHIPGMGMEKYINQTSKGEKYREAYFVDHLSPDVETLGTIMKEAGYETAYLGKWHLAGEGGQKTADGIINPNWHPDKYGFDINLGGCAYGQPATYFSPYKNKTLPDGPDGEYLTDRLGNEAVKYIKDHQNKPFFLYLSFYSVHTPYQAPEEVIKANKGNKYFGLIQKMDENVGKVLTALETMNMSDNTLVIFYSDNGGVTNNAPVRGVKGELLEGGIRVPLIVRWPGKVKPHTVCDVPVTGIDFFPTLNDLVHKGEMANTKTSEAHSILPLLKGKHVRWGNRFIFWHYPHNRKNIKYAMSSAVRKGEWKLIYSYNREKYELFNLKDDIKESKDLSSLYPKIASQLYNELIKWQKSVDAEMPRKNINN